LEQKSKIPTVLIAPLDWGLGHATRCIPVIKIMNQNGWRVILAADGNTATLLKNEFPDLLLLTLKGYNIHYSTKKWMLPFTILLQIPKILSTIKTEHYWLQNTINTHQIDLVISDNRYGLHSSKIPSVFITHQLTIKMPIAWLERWVQKINYSYIQKFSQCWVPDFEGKINIAGVLSHPKTLLNIPTKYIGPLSRFITKENVAFQYTFCILLSGPEPQRTILEKIILKDTIALNEKIILVRGEPNATNTISSSDRLTIYNHLSGEALNNVIQASEYIISRSGYTTVMELMCLQKKSILIPTPAQTEQEYLAEKLYQQQWCYVVPQHDFNIQSAMIAAKQFNYQLPEINNQKLPSTILKLIEQLSN
jgi:uncharacterized protein (TIGR00661 family)